MIDPNKRFTKLLSKEYRDDFLQTTVRSAVAYQVQALRAKFRMSQAEFAIKTGKKQSTISRLESTEYGKVSVQTLLDIASALDVALIVRFSDYPNFLATADQMSVIHMQPDTIEESAERRVSTGINGTWANAIGKQSYSQPVSSSRQSIATAMNKPLGRQSHLSFNQIVRQFGGIQNAA